MSDPGPILGIIEDDPVMGQSLVDWFTVEGYQTLWWRNGTDALAALATVRPDVLLCDVRLPDMTGEDILREAAGRLGRTPVVFITGYGEVPQAVRLMQSGAVDYLTKPFDIERLSRRVESLLQPRWLLTEGWALGQSPAIITIERLLRRVVNIESTVLLTGPSGSGKEVAARFLHASGMRAKQPFLALNCAAIPKDLLESELFGHEKGAFSGAIQKHEGCAERAAGGTLFLDEVAELPLALQAKLLRLVEERHFYRVGGERIIQLRARIVAATNADLARRTAEGLFRPDLYFRLAVIAVDLPALKDRPEDILPLARRMTGEFAETFGRAILGIAPQAEAELQSHAFAGNIRELRNRIERAVALSEGGWLTTADLFPERVKSAAEVTQPPLSLAGAREATERRMIEAALETACGDVEAAAVALDVSRSTLFAKIKKLGIRQ